MLKGVEFEKIFCALEIGSNQILILLLQLRILNVMKNFYPEISELDFSVDRWKDAESDLIFIKHA